MMNKKSGFFNELRLTFGDGVWSLVKKLANLSRIQAASVNRKIFLLQCKNNSVYPKFITHNIKSLFTLLLLDGHPFKYLVENIMENFKKSVLNAEIKVTHWKLSRLESERKRMEEELMSSVPADMYCWCLKINKIRYEKIFRKIKKKNQNKIMALIKDVTPVVPDVSAISDSKVLYNFLNESMPEFVENVLKLSPNFGIELDGNKLPIPTLIKDLEFGISRVKDQTLDERELEVFRNNIRLNGINTITNFYNSSRRRINVADKNLKKDLIKTKLFLKNRDDILVMRADKGGATVLMKKKEYETGMLELLNDPLIYKRVQRDPTAGYQDTINAVVDDLAQRNIIEDWEVKYLKTHNGLPPRLYGLRKVHKPGCKLRPVVSCIKSPCYKLAKFLHRILTPLVDTYKFNIKNSTELVKLLKDVKLPSDYVLVSLDVVSLFTNIPKKLVLRIIQDEWDLMKGLVKVPKEILEVLVKTCFETSYFKYNNSFYRQLDGSSMGNPASPVLANIVMEHVLRKILERLPFAIPLLCLYVDDTLLAVPKDSTNLLLDHFNSFCSKIQFTMELEVEGELAFLDTLVIRKVDGSLKTRWFQKPTSSGRLLNFNSHHPLAHKTSVALGLIYRAIKLSSSCFHKDNLLIVKDILKRNNYPSEFVDCCIERFKKTHLDDNSVNAVDKQENRFRFPFIKGLSQNITRCFRKSDWKPAFYNIKKIGHIYSKLKDPVKLRDRSDIIYKIECSCGLAYVGQTTQYLKKRIYQHQYSCRDKNKTKDLTALAAHHFETGHQFDFENVKILDNESIKLKRNYSEMIQICLHNTVNCKTDTENLNCLYLGLIDKFKMSMNV